MSKKSDLKVRVMTAVVFAVVTLTLISINKYSSSLFFLIVAFGCYYEYLGTSSKNQLYKIISSLALCGIFCYFLFKNDNRINDFLSGYAIAIMIFSFVALYLKKLLKLHQYFPIGMAMSVIIAPLYLFASINYHNYNGKLLLFVLLMIWSADSFAYLFGRKLGRRKLFPSVSPNKSWEGFLISGIVTIILGYFISLFLIPEFKTESRIIIIIGAWAIGGIGDLVQSSIKRFSSIKDSGSLLPGHGGLWDRFDSFIFISPIIYLVMVYLEN